MASCVTQAQVAHRSHLGPSRLSADGVSGASAPCPVAGKTCCTNMVRAYLVNKENEMKRIGALSGMRWRMLLLVLQAGYTADVAVADHEIDESDFLCAASDGPESVRVERVLPAGQIDSSTVDVGALAVVVYEQGERHPISGAWTQLDTVRGYIKAVDSRRLIVGLEPDGWSKWIALERIQTLSLIGAPFSSSADRDRTRTRTTKRVQPAQAEPEAARSDSLSEQMEAMVKRYYTKADNREALRIAKKVAAGTLSGVVFTAIGTGVQAARWEDPDPYTPSDGLEGIVFFVQGLLVGSMVGFPIGVTLVDPHDSFAATLMGGLIPGLAGYTLIEVGGSPAIGVMMALFSPIISLHASEKSRKPPQDRRVSFGLAPTLNGGLSVVTQLRF